MLGFIRNLKVKYGIHEHYVQCDNAREMRVLNVFANWKEWVFDLNTLPQDLHNIMVELNENVLPFLIGYMPCSTVGNFLLFSSRDLSLFQDF